MKKDARLDARQISILKEFFKRSLDGENMETVAKDKGINRKTLSQWKNTNHGGQIYDEYMKELSKNDKPMFYQKLKEGVAKNSYKHLELYAKIHGILAPEKKEIVTEERKASDSPISKERLDEIRKRLEETVAEADRPIKRVK
ncbi:phBC6A51 family helix-turn-helix protein [Rossellomorea aquimaris]|nr:phBC6A51 family helix-turn-helix protein [Rossellomorea aquimaris]WRP06887.1 phBC6A51 family helix-turn-helix protein [Rossellomorea aquimaris]